MKLMVASDTHGSFVWTEKLIELFKNLKCDKLLLLGDYLYHGPRNDLPDIYDTRKTSEILNTINDKIIAVRGNCDSRVDYTQLNFSISDTAFLNIDNLNFYASHGDIYNESCLPAINNIDIIFGGHTHTPVFNKHEDYIFINPGSVSIPRGGSSNSCLVYENRNFKFYDLTNFNVYKEYNI